MPESRARKKADYTPPPTRPAGPQTSPGWYAPVMVALLVLGLLYVVVFYVTDGKYPIDALGPWINSPPLDLAQLRGHDGRLRDGHPLALSLRGLLTPVSFVPRCG